MFFFKQKTECGMRISDWSSDVCSSDLGDVGVGALLEGKGDGKIGRRVAGRREIAQMVDSLELLLDHLRRRVLERLGIGSGVDRVDGDRGRRDVGKLRDRQDRKSVV